MGQLFRFFFEHQEIDLSYWTFYVHKTFKHKSNQIVYWNTSAREVIDLVIPQLLKNMDRCAMGGSVSLYLKKEKNLNNKGGLSVSGVT